MNARVSGILLAAALLLGPALASFEGASREAAAAEGKLGALGSALKGGSSRSGGGRTFGGSTGEALLAELLVEFFVHAAPYLLFPHYPFYYQAYPYQLGRGYLEYYGDTPFTTPETVPLSARHITFEVRGGYMIDSAELQGYRVYGKARLSYLFTMDAEATEFWEWLPGGDFDSLALLKVDGLFNISNSPYHDLDLGFGMSYLDGVNLYGGINAKLTCDFFPVKPLGIHLASCASAFEGGTLYETEAMLGLFARNFELRFGYRALWVEGIRIDGPMMELAIWF